jgi:uncharacterized membrane protein YhhN
MEAFLRKRVLIIYWIVLLIHCILQHYHTTYVAITKPFLLPLLILYLFLHDDNIGSPAPKFIFYIGLFLAFFGDVLLILINDTFFLSGMIAFMLMNITYSISFLLMTPIRLKKILPALLTFIALFFIGYYFYGFLKDDLGDYSMPIVAYMITLSIMVTASVNLVTNTVYQKSAIRYLVPGAIVFVIENVLVAFNKFHYNRDKDVFVIVMITYGVAQFLMVTGISDIYLKKKPAKQ